MKYKKIKKQIKMFLFNIINVFVNVFANVFVNIWVFYNKINKYINSLDCNSLDCNSLECNSLEYSNSLDKRMKTFIERNNGKIRHCYKPYIISIKSKSLLTHINNIKNNSKYKSIIEDKVNLLNIINEVLIEVSRKIYLKFDPTMIYTFNNEINIVFFYNENGESIYDGNINKILTSIVSYASICISKELEKQSALLDFIFDGHFIEFDKDYEILNFLIWRQFECKRNIITLLYKCLHNKNNINNLTLDDMKYDLPLNIISPELFTGIIIKKRIFKILTSNIAWGNTDQDINKENNTVQKTRKSVGVEHFYFHKDFKNNFTKYIKTKIIN